MSSIETKIGNRKYILSSEDDVSHLEAVAEMVSKKVEALQKTKPGISLQKAAILASFDFASLLINGKRKGLEYQSNVISKTVDVLEKVQSLQQRPESS